MSVARPIGGVTDEQLRAFRRDGFLVHGQLISELEAIDLGDHLDELARSGSDSLISRRVEGDNERFTPQGEADPALVAQLIGPADADERLHAQVTDPRMIEIVRRLLGRDDIRLFGNQALMKPARHGSPVSWHQDSGYWNDFVHDLDPPTIVTAWLAIDPVTEANGCVRMLPGSHRAGPLPHEFHDDDVMRHVEGVDVEAAVPIVLPRGGVSFHHSCTVHGSGPNVTSHRRRGFAMHFVRGDFGWQGRGPRPDLPAA